MWSAIRIAVLITWRFITEERETPREASGNTAATRHLSEFHSFIIVLQRRVLCIVSKSVLIKYLLNRVLIIIHEEKFYLKFRTYF